MIERLLAAEEALARDELDHAQRLYGQIVEADPRNAIAVVGLAQVLARRGDTDAARELLAHALRIDPDEAAARRVLAELDADRDPGVAAAATAWTPAAGTPAPGRPEAASATRSVSAATHGHEKRGLAGRLRRILRIG